MFYESRDVPQGKIVWEENGTRKEFLEPGTDPTGLREQCWNREKMKADYHH